MEPSSLSKLPMIGTPWDLNTKSKKTSLLSKGNTAHSKRSGLKQAQSKERSADMKNKKTTKINKFEMPCDAVRVYCIYPRINLNSKVPCGSIENRWFTSFP